MAVYAYYSIAVTLKVFMRLWLLIELKTFYNLRNRNCDIVWAENEYKSTQWKNKHTKQVQINSFIQNKKTSLTKIPVYLQIHMYCYGLTKLILMKDYSKLIQNYIKLNWCNQNVKLNLLKLCYIWYKLKFYINDALY